jgi:AcrR family transcriptional regulator
MSRPSSKEAILDAAETIVREEGAVHMTLDAVAEHAGVSKGGVMYNFPTKDALLEAMVSRMVRRLDQVRGNVRQGLSEENRTELVVEIRMLQSEYACDRRLGIALMAVAATQPALTQAIREEMHNRFFGEIFTEQNITRASILYFAALGLHFHDLLHLSLLDSKEKNAVFEELLSLANGEGEFWAQDLNSSKQDA